MNNKPGLKIFHLLLIITFIVTLLVPLTGIHIHKLVSALFLLLCVIHTILYRKKLRTKTFLVLALVIISFFTGIFGMIFDSYVIIMKLHKVISIAVVFFLAIHIFVFRNKI